MKFYVVAHRPIVIALAALLILTGCGGDGDGGAEAAAGGNLSVSARSIPLEPGDADCPHGGILVESGIDENGNGMLDDDEVDRAEKVCHGAPGADGLSALVKTGNEPPGTNCPAGGVRIDSGLDADGDGILSSGEIEATHFLCNGSDGVAGPPGIDGSDGLSTLLTFSDEPPGANCPWGGMRVESGFDADGDGTLQPGEVSETRFVCSLIEGTVGWQVGEAIDNGSGAVSSPQIAVTADGSAFAIWQQFNGTHNEIWVNRHDPANGWGAANRLVAGSHEFENPAIAVAADGSAIAVWQQSDGTVDIWANRYDPDSGWGMARRMGASYTWDENPAVAMSNDGSAIVVWGMYMEGSEELAILAWRYISGSGWASEEETVLYQIEEFAPPAHGLSEAQVLGPPRIATAPDGTAIVVWRYRLLGSLGGVTLANRYVPGSGWDVPQRIDGTVNVAVESPQIVMGADGSAIAVWTQLDGGRSAVWSNRFSPDDGWGSPRKIEAGDGDAGLVQIAMDSGGSAVVVWRQWDTASNRWDLWANRYDPATGWATAERIEHRAGNVDSPSIAMAADGSAMALWVQEDGSRTTVWSNRFVPGTGWGTAQPVERNGTGSAATPRIGFDGDGNATALWTQKSADGSRTDIRASRWIAP